jgi:hypothetical protein
MKTNTAFEEIESCCTLAESSLGDAEMNLEDNEEEKEITPTELLLVSQANSLLAISRALLLIAYKLYGTDPLEEN